MPKKTTYHHGNLKTELLLCAEQMLVELGVEGISLRGVAKAAGVSHTAPYRHFKDKQTLLAEIGVLGFARLEQGVIDTVLNYPGEYEKQLEETGVHYTTTAIESPEVFHLMFGQWCNKSLLPESYKTAKSTAFETFRGMIQQGIEAEHFVQMPSLDLAVMLWSLMHGLASLAIDQQLEHPEKPHFVVADTAREMATLVLRGVRG